MTTYSIPTALWFQLDDQVNSGYDDVTAQELADQYGLPQEAVQAIRDEFGIQ